jgi:hypothetical protein
MSNEVYIYFNRNINGIIYNIKLNLYNSNHIIINPDLSSYEMIYGCDLVSELFSDIIITTPIFIDYYNEEDRMQKKRKKVEKINLSK